MGFNDLAPPTPTPSFPSINRNNYEKLSRWPLAALLSVASAIATLWRSVMLELGFGDVATVAVAVTVLAFLAVGLVRIALQGFLGVAFGVLCAGCLASLALSMVSVNLLALGLTAEGVPNASLVGTVIQQAPFLRAILLALALPSVTTIALLALLFLIAFYARVAAGLARDAEVLFAHMAAFAVPSESAAESKADKKTR
jgi:hypothetical protein